MLRGCSHDVQLSVVKTYKDIECLAKEICTKPDIAPETPSEAPVACIDPEVVEAEEGAECNPAEVYGCLWEFHWNAMNPFAMDNKMACS